MLGAEQARLRYAPEVAAEQYAIAKRNVDQTPNAVRYRIAEGYSEALLLLGRYDEAIEELRGAIDLVDDPQRKARIEALEGEIALKQGLMDKSVSLYESGLRRLGVRVPKSTLGLVSEVTREALVQTGHSLRPQRLHRQTPSESQNLAIRLLFRIGMPYCFQNSLKMLSGASVSNQPV